MFFLVSLLLYERVILEISQQDVNNSSIVDH